MRCRQWFDPVRITHSLDSDRWREPKTFPPVTALLAKYPIQVVFAELVAGFLLTHLGADKLE
jgi:hypothetical protein